MIFFFLFQKGYIIWLILCDFFVELFERFLNDSIPRYFLKNHIEAHKYLRRAVVSLHRNSMEKLAPKSSALFMLAVHEWCFNGTPELFLSSDCLKGIRLPFSTQEGLSSVFNLSNLGSCFSIIAFGISYLLPTEVLGMLCVCGKACLLI